MQLRITGDSNEDSGISEVMYELSGPTRKHFAARDYGTGMHGLGLILICRNSDLKFKKRIRFSKKDKILYMDIMLDLEQMKYSKHEVRKQIIIERLIEEIPITIKKYNFPEFDDINFVNDLKGWLQKF